MNGFAIRVQDVAQYESLYIDQPVSGDANQARHLVDPEGNILRIEQSQGDLALGACGVIQGVSNLEQAITFYQDVLGFSTVADAIQEQTLTLPTRDGVMCAGEYRSVRLQDRNSDNWMELVQKINLAGRPMPFATNWGDFGYLQNCFSSPSASVASEQLIQLGNQMLCSPHPAGPGPAEEVGEFVYATDPDGSPIEFLFLP